MRFRHRARALLCSTVGGGLVAGLALVVVPTTAPTNPAPPHVTSQRIALTGSTQTAGAGWSKSVNVKASVVGVTWTGAASTSFSVETRNAQGTWTKATSIGNDDQSGGPDNGTAEAAHATKARATEPYFVGDATAVRVKVDAGSARDLQLHAVNAPEAQASDSTAAAAMVGPNGQPAMISRAQWGADEGLRLANCSAPDYDARVRFAIVHHTAGTNNYSAAQVPSMMRAFYAYDTQQLGYCDIAYNFLIDKWGRIWEGRYGGVDQAVHGAHTLGFNTESTGVAVIGDYSNAAPPTGALQSLEQLLAWKLSISGVDPMGIVTVQSLGNEIHPVGQWLTIPTIIGHRDVGQTACPGQAFWNILPYIRYGTRLTYPQVPGPQFSGWTPQAGAPKVVMTSPSGGEFPAGRANAVGADDYPGWDVIRDVTLSPFGGGYLLDAFGGIHPFGGAPALARPPQFTLDAARALVLTADGRGGYVLDAFGGIHAIGNAPPMTASQTWPGWDIARKISLRSDGPGGYTMDAYGGLHPFGGAPVIAGGPYWPNSTQARGLAANPNGPGVWVLDSYGGVHNEGGAPALVSHGYFPNTWMVTGFAILSTGTGGYLTDSHGNVYPIGDAPTVRVAAPTPASGWRRTIAIAALS